MVRRTGRVDMTLHKRYEIAGELYMLSSILNYVIFDYRNGDKSAKEVMHFVVKLPAMFIKILKTKEL